MYKINYDNGNPCSIQKDETMSIPICLDNMDFVAFLEWNAEQKIPLDYKTPIEIEPPEPPETLEEQITRIATKVAKEEH